MNIFLSINLPDAHEFIRELINQAIRRVGYPIDRSIGWFCRMHCITDESCVDVRLQDEYQQDDGTIPKTQQILSLFNFTICYNGDVDESIYYPCDGQAPGQDMSRAAHVSSKTKIHQWTILP